MHRLRAYFYSGWAFLIPYLLLYLLYYALKWPVNPGSGRLLPSLLHVYWALHALHLTLAAFALQSWWSSHPARAFDSAQSADSTSSLLATRYPLLPVVIPLAPWLLLALIFYLPGVYLEWPSDPWQHYARTNEWSHMQTVGENLIWTKSSYFLAYSLIGRTTPPLLQLRSLNVYYTACCLLLCWQYCRLGHAVGLGRRASFGFVVLQVFIFGNSIFGFYRYYGIASTLFAQLGAIALTRIALQAAQRRRFLNSSLYSPLSDLHRSAPKTRAISSLLIVLSLLALIALNHGQGLAIAVLGVGAVGISRLVDWKSSMIWWVGGVTLAMNIATIIWWPRFASIDSIYRPAGWLTTWYGFNLLSSPTIPFGPFDRTMAIVGIFGMINVIIGFALLFRNHVVGWLTILPPLALSLPIVAIPFAEILLKHNPVEGLSSFSRTFFAIPAGLAIVTFVNGLMKSTKKDPGRKTMSWRRFPALQPPWLLLLTALGMLTLVPGGRPYYNRFYNVFSIPPWDLAMRHAIKAVSDSSVAADAFDSSADAASPSLNIFKRYASFLVTPGIGYVLQSTGTARIPWASRQIDAVPSTISSMLLHTIGRLDRTSVRTLPFGPTEMLYTSQSHAGFLSAHWPSAAVSIAHSTQRELFTPPPFIVPERPPPQLWLELLSGPEQSHYFGAGAGSPLISREVNYGNLNLIKNFRPPQAQHPMTLRPVLRTTDGTGWRIAVTISGPGVNPKIREFSRHPFPLRGDDWLSADFEVSFPQPGSYKIDVIGDVIWPSNTYKATYTLHVAP